MARYLWTQKEDIGPSPRMAHAMAYDSTRARTILFGGDPLGSAMLGDTWEWDGEFWTQVSDIGPPARSAHAACFDRARNVVLLFGGASGGALLGDTWGWNASDWTQLEDTGPSARSGHAMAFDATRGRALLFGGQSAGGLHNDTWEWDGNAWTQLEDTGPPPRRNHMLAYDPVNGRVVLFGGDPGGRGAALGDTWAWNGSNWTQISDFGPKPCYAAAMIGSDVRISMFGGLAAAGGGAPPIVLYETWALDGSRWTQRQDIGPGARWGHAMAYDSARRTIVLFGGLPIFGPPGDGTLSGQLLRDTWEHTETDAIPGGSPGGGPVPGSGSIDLQLSPASAPPGTSVQATVTIASTSATTQVQLMWMLQSAFDATVAANQPISQSDLTLLQAFAIPAGVATMTQVFAVPAANEPLVVIAVTGDGAAALAPLGIT